MSNDEKLTVLAQKELWYSPLFVNDVELENILFYNSIDGVIFQTNRGWLSCGNCEKQKSYRVLFWYL